MCVEKLVQAMYETAVDPATTRYEVIFTTRITLGDLLIVVFVRQSNCALCFVQHAFPRLTFH